MDDEDDDESEDEAVVPQDSPKAKAKVRKNVSKYDSEIADLPPAERRKALAKLYERNRASRRKRVKSKYEDHPTVKAAKTAKERRAALNKLYASKKKALQSTAMRRRPLHSSMP